MKRMKKAMSALLAALILIISFPFSGITTLADVITGDEFDVNIIYEAGSRRYGEITAYHGESATVTFPSRIDDVRIVGVAITKQPNAENKLQTVTLSEGIIYIGANTFSRCSDLNITLPESLRYIGTRAFYASSVRHINFPSGLQGIDMFAFNETVFSDTELTLPESLQYIGNCAFAESNITACHMGSRVRFANMEYAFPGSIIERYAAVDIPGIGEEIVPFVYCNDIRDITVSQNNPFLAVTDNALYTDGGRTLQYVAGDRDSFTVNDNVETLCKYAFHKGQHIGTLYIGSGLQTLPEDAFAAMHIGRVQFSSNCSLESIRYGAFSDTAIEEPLTIPKSVREIESDAFSTAQLSDVRFETNSALSTIHHHAFFNATVKSIDFTNCHALTLLGRECFADSSLQSADLSNTLIEKLEGYTFAGCEELTCVILSDYTSELGSNCFKDCDSLEEVRYGYSVSYTAGENIPLQHDTAFIQWTTVGDFRFAEYEDYASLTDYSGEKEVDILTIPDTVNGKPVKEIRKNVFNASLKQCRLLVLPEQLEVICSNAFFNSGIAAVESFPSTLKYIGTNAFASNRLTELQLNDGLLYIGGSAFRGCEIANFMIPDTTVRVSYFPFKQCQTLQFGADARNIEETLGMEEETGEEKRKALTAITVSESNPCYTTKDGVLYNKDMTQLIYYPAAKADREFVVPESVRVIGEQAFQQAQHLEKITFTGVRRIGRYAFEGCGALETLIFKSGVDLQRLNQTFTELSTLKNVVFEDGAKVVQLNYTFCGTSLNAICLPASVRAVNGAFADVNTLESVTFSEGIETIGAAAFRQTSITSLSLPQSLRHIAQDAFSGCVYLQQLALGGTQYIGKNAFAECQSLTQVDLTGVRTEPDAFSYCTHLKKICYDDGTVQAPITEEAFEGNETVETVVIGTSVSEIQERAFAECSALSTAYISESVTKIADDAFDGCHQLTIVCLPGSAAMQYAINNRIPYQTFVIAPIPDQPYTGRPVTPSLQVSQGGKRLTKDKDYQVSYRNNTAIGTAGVTVVGVGDYRIFGATAKFNIVAAPKNGWEKVGNKWYYYTSNGTARGWKHIGGKWYYFNASGVMQTGWQKLGGTWYYLNSSGAMKTGWQKIGGAWYLFNASGAMLTGWQKSGSSWYYFNSSGAMVTGWQKIGSTWYYFNASGAMVTGWKYIGGSWYYFESSGAMRTANLTQGGKTYKFNSSGACLNP